ncbi:MAG TPA: hypothetical protein DCY07_05665 [Rhodospirillaceae bacterium]|nr:hypothetical protein [Rhodospirillaceae bacterium]
MNNLQDYSNERVPENEGPRFRWLYLTNVEVAVAVCVPVFMFGAMLGQSMDMMHLGAALLLGGLILSLLTGWSSYIGVKTRLSTALLVKGSFGETGAKFVWLVLALSLFGWFGVQTELFAKAFLMLMKSSYPDVAMNPTLVTIVAGLLMSSTAILGIKGVGKLAQLSIPLLLGAMIYALYEVIAEKGIAAWVDFTPAAPMAVGAAVAAIVGGYSVGIITMPDVNRFALNKKHAITAGVVSLGICYPLLVLLTAMSTALTGEADFMVLLMGLGMGSLTLVILMLATWTTNDVNLYAASLSLAPMFPKVPRPWLTAVSGLLGTLVATFGLFENMVGFFIILGVLTTPLLAIYSLDYLSGVFDRPFGD